MRFPFLELACKRALALHLRNVKKSEREVRAVVDSNLGIFGPQVEDYRVGAAIKRSSCLAIARAVLVIGGKKA